VHRRDRGLRAQTFGHAGLQRLLAEFAKGVVAALEQLARATARQARLPQSPRGNRRSSSRLDPMPRLRAHHQVEYVRRAIPRLEFASQGTSFIDAINREIVA
jgi:YibE/F-like protein